MEKLKLEKILKNNGEISSTFCVYPWVQFIIGPSTNIKLCCLSEKPIKNENGKSYTFNKDTMEDYWNGYGLKQIRKKMLAGEKIKACEHCYHQESLGRTSTRRSSNKSWFESEYGKDILNRIETSRTNSFRVDKTPLYLDIRPGNLCNLKCRMCNPENSSKIYQEPKQLLKDNPEINSLIDTRHFKTDEKKFHSWYKNKKIWETIYKWTPGIKQLYFTGGEPTLIKENWEFIDYLKQKGYSKNIHLIFNINCTQAPDKLLDTFSTFAKVEINFSVDGYKEVQEYIRYPSQWKNIESNIIELLKNRKKTTYFNFTSVIQVYNILNLIKFSKWIHNLQKKYGEIKTNMIMCTGPEFLDISILPNSIKKEALLRIKDYEKSYKGNDYFFLECLGAIKNVLKAEEKTGIEKLLKRFYRYTALLDKKRGNSFEKTFPELHYFFEKDGRWKN